MTDVTPDSATRSIPDPSPAVLLFAALVSVVARYRHRTPVLVSDQTALGPGEKSVGLTVHQLPGVETLRFWQEGPGYDRNLDRVDTVLAAIDYIHRNPERRGLVDREIDWQWSSARWYESMPNLSNLRLPKLERLPAEFLAQATS
jgi:hypothetical protein